MTRSWILWVLAVVSGAAGAAPAAEVVVKGEGLEGTVVAVTSEAVEFETTFGSGAIAIPWQDVDEIQSDKEFMVLYGDDQDAVGRIWGVEDGSVLVGESAEQAERVPIDSIFRSLSREQLEESWLESLRARNRYWSADWGLGFAYTDATTDTLNFDTHLDIERKKGPSRLQLGAYYRYGTTKEQGSAKATNEDRIFGRAYYSHDVYKSLFAYGAVSATYDSVQRLSIRLDPNAGMGWRFLERETLTMSARMGAGYVYQSFFGGATEDYPAIVFGSDLEWDLPYDSKVTWKTEYLPSVSAWTENYLIRTNAVLTVPIIGWLDFRFRIFDEYNNQPAAGTQRNTFTTTAGISFGF